MFASKSEFEQKKKENLKDMIKALENEKESYILTAFDEGVRCITGSPKQVLTQVVSILNVLYESGIPKEIILESVNLAFEDKEKIIKSVDDAKKEDIDKNLERAEKILDELKELAKLVK